MKQLTLTAVLTALCLLGSGCGRVTAPAPYGPIPTPQQVAWQQMEMNLFVHFGPNTFTGREWGLGTEAEDVFCPTDLDCRQWASTARAAGFKGIIVTAKHHDGFCLWPNPVSTHTVAQSPWKDGKGDVLKELSEACAAEGLKFGVYISPWDRNDPHYGSPAYNEVYVKTLESALTGYGPVFEEWFDGANGEGPNGKRQEYDWPLFHQTVRTLQPDAVMFSDVGPGCRWVGNEQGYAGQTNWSRLNIEGFTPGAGAPANEILNTGESDGAVWLPAETDVSIRPGWFWRESENDQVKPVRKLLDIYYTSVGRNSLLLLNVPPDTTGHLHPIDSARLIAFREALDRVFAEDLSDGARAQASSCRGRAFRAGNILDGKFDSYWAPAEEAGEAEVTILLKGTKTFNRVLLQEYIPLGQRIKSFTVEAAGPDGEWKCIAEETTVGYKRILCTDEVTADRLRIRITDAFATPLLNGFGLYLDREE